MILYKISCHYFFANNPISIIECEVQERKTTFLDFKTKNIYKKKDLDEIGTQYTKLNNSLTCITLKEKNISGIINQMKKIANEKLDKEIIRMLQTKLALASFKYIKKEKINE